MTVVEAAWTRDAIRTEAERLEVAVYLLSDTRLIEKVERAKRAHASGDVLSVDEFFEGLLS